MRALISLLSALGLAVVLMGQAPSAAAKKSVPAKKTTAKKATTGAKPTAASSATFANDDEKVLYTIGLFLNQRNQQQLDSLDLSAHEKQLVRQGLLDAMDSKPALKLDDWGPKINEYASARAQKASEKASVEQKAKGAAYLAKAAAEAGALKLDSGVIYKELTAGKGPNPTPENTVKVNYRGTLIDGTEFDSSYKRNEPAEFPLGGVIPCWTEGVQKMKVGGKAQLVCPSDRAYGDRGSPPTILPGATLIFEVELLEIKAEAAAPPPQN
jgi:FKBP-type peptidyl-prolyl cis-trans isomerase FkpA